MRDRIDEKRRNSLKHAGKRFNLLPYDVPPRVLLFFFSIPVQLIASALSGVGYSSGNTACWVSGFVFWLLWFLLIFLIVIPGKDNHFQRYAKGLKRWAVIIFVVVLVSGIAELLVLTLFTPAYLKSGAHNDFSMSLEQMQHGFQYNDGTALSQQAAENLLDGKNPYAEANIVTAFHKYKGFYDRVTPLRTGRLANVFPYPTQEQLKQIWDSAIIHPSVPPPELESQVCYPSGSFLLLTPFIKVGIKDIRWIYFIFVMAGLVYALFRIPGRRRLLFAGLALISLELWNSLAIGETGSLIFPFLLIAWISIKKNNWLSAFFMGVAVATKQTAWFFLPFYLILLWRTSGVKTAAMAVGVITAIFLAANTYFIVLDPSLWLKSITAPLNAAMFPLGVGIVSLVTSGLLNIQAQLPFMILEMLAFIVAILWYWRNCSRYPDAGLILAVLPFFFAWRSLWTYFFYITIIILARMLISEGENDLSEGAVPRQPTGH